MIPDDFAQECLYTRDRWYLHELLVLDREAGRVVGRLDTTRIGPETECQIVRPGHPRHLPAMVAIQMTATLGNLHAVYVLGLRISEGWVGFGTHIRAARFPNLGQIGPPVDAELRATRIRKLRRTWFTDYTFRFEQEGRVVYESEQTAAWGPGSPG